MTRHAEPPLPKQARGEGLDPFTDTPTNLITLSPAFLHALRQIAPKARPRKLRYVLAIAAIGAIGAIGWMAGRRLQPFHDAAAHEGPAAEPARAQEASSAEGGTAASARASNGTPMNATERATAPAPVASSAPTAAAADTPRVPKVKPSKATKSRTKQAAR